MTMTQYTPVVYVKLGGKANSTTTTSDTHGTVCAKRRRCSRCWMLLLIVPVLALLLPLPFLADIAADNMSNRQEDVTLSDSVTSLSLNLYSELASKSVGENIFFSPYSIVSALGMTLMGCRSNTRTQLAALLKLNADDDTVAGVFREAITKYQSAQEDFELRTANMMYVSHLQPVTQHFSDHITKAFSAAAKTVDFGGATEAVRVGINTEVEKVTNSKIKDLIQPGVLNSLTRMVLVNAVYFKGQWARMFKAEHTQDKPFWVTQSESIKVPMMYINAEFPYGVVKELQSTVIAMDYKGSNMTMLIFLPGERTGISLLESNLASLDIEKTVNSLQKTKVEVTLPRFKLEYEQDLKDSLLKLGVSDLFTAGVSDMTGVSPTADLFVSNVLHKAFVEVNEEGTEAAAATAAVMMTRMLIRMTPPFVADHPFMFMIYDRALKMPLFTGRLAKPEQTKAKQEL